MVRRLAEQRQPLEGELTLPDALREASGLHPNPRAGLTFLGGDGSERHYPFDELYRGADERARRLVGMGLRKGDRIGLALPDGEDFVLTFLGAVFAGIVPVAVYPPLGLGRLDAYMEGTARMLDKAGARMLVTPRKLQAVIGSLRDRVPSLEQLLDAELLASPVPGDVPELAPIGPDDVAFLQFTSGSTTAPRGVVVPHRSLNANVRAMIHEGADLEPGVDVCVSWLPLYHDMGLIGAVLAMSMTGVDTVLMPTTSFIKRPARWMEALSHYRGTVTFAPNFAYGLTVKRMPAERVAELDLSSVRMICAGSEPNRPRTLRRFLEHFEPAGLRPEAIQPVYGMAEATMGMAMGPVDEVFRTDVVQAQPYRDAGRAVPATGRSEADGAETLEYVSVGRPLARHGLEIVDEAGRPLPEREVGEIRFSGPSVTAGYLDDPEETARAFEPEGLRTGDLGYLADGELYITGRKKDLIILNGRNYDPHTIEWVVAEVEGVRTGNVVAFSRPGAETEGLVVVAEARIDLDDAVAHDRLVAAVRRRLRQEMRVDPAEVALYEAGTIPKTTSGKLQRERTRRQYLDGTLGAEGVRGIGVRGEKVTLARHVARSVWSRVRQELRSRGPAFVGAARDVFARRARR